MTHVTEVLADTPNAVFDLDEASGTTMTDSSGNGRNGTYVGAVGLGQASITRDEADTCAAFTGANGILGWVASNAWQVPTDFTIEARVKPNGTSGIRTIASKYANTGPVSSYIFRQETDNRVAFYIWHSSTFTAVTSTTYLVPGFLYTVACTYNGTTREMKIYVNGVLEATGTAAAAMNSSTASFAVGARDTDSGTAHTGRESFNGTIKRVSLTPSILSEARLLVRHQAAQIDLAAAIAASGESAGTIAAGVNYTGITINADASSSGSVLAIKGIGTAYEVETAWPFGIRMPLGTSFDIDEAYELLIVPMLLFGGIGVTTVDSETMVILTEMQLSLTDTVLARAPTSLTVTVIGGQAQTEVVFDIDGTDVYTTDLNSEGALGATSINVSAALGTAGTHTLTASQVTLAGVIAASIDFEIQLAPAIYPAPPTTDAPPVLVPGSVTVDNARHWVLQDLLPEEDGGVGDYIFLHNPRSMTSPHHEHFMTARPTTSHDGVAHIFQAATGPKEWTFSGFCPSEAHQAAIMQYRHLNRRFYLIDHHNRAWMVIFTNAEFVPRKRLSYNGEITDWGSDFTVTATVLDQNWTTPA